MKSNRSTPLQTLVLRVVTITKILMKMIDRSSRDARTTKISTKTKTRIKNNFLKTKILRDKKQR